MGDNLKRYLDMTAISGARTPDGERFCVVSRDDLLRNFGIRSWVLAEEGVLREQLRGAGMEAATLDTKFEQARLGMSGLICGRRAG
jgi:hypothetical protein